VDARSLAVIDSIFLIDVLLQFTLMFPSPDSGSPQGERWVSSPSRIAKKYVFGFWFPIDILSIGVSGFDMFSPPGGALSKFKGLRAIRVLRLVKLVRSTRHRPRRAAPRRARSPHPPVSQPASDRCLPCAAGGACAVLNASRIFERWEKRLSINYQLLAIIKLLFALLFGCHLFACIWGLQASFDPLSTWPAAKGHCVAHDTETDGPCPDGRVCDDSMGTACVGASEMYLYSWYFALATVTSIGYGDVSASAFHQSEQAICSVIMLVGALVFAYLIGNFCALASALSPDLAQFRFDLSDLNSIMSKESIPADLRYKLREYMHNTGHLRTSEIRRGLFKKLSPGLAGEFALKMNERWLNQVWFLQMLQQRVAPGYSHELEGLHFDLAQSLVANVFAPGEMCPNDRLYVLVKGRVLYSGRMYKVGQSWGTDVILSAEELRFRFLATATVYVWTHSIMGDVLREMIAKHRELARVMRQLEVRWIFRRSIVRAAEEKLQAEGKSGFHGRMNFLLARHPNDLRAIRRVIGKDQANTLAGKRAQTITGASEHHAGIVLEQERQAKQIDQISTSVDGLRKDMQALLEAIKNGAPMNEMEA
jgi:hypothetical protein